MQSTEYQLCRERDLYIAPNASFFIKKCSKIINVWGSIRFKSRWENLNCSAPLPCSCFNLGSRMGGPTEYIIWTTQLKPLFKSGQRLCVRVYLDHHVQSYMFLKNAMRLRRNEHYFEMYQNRRYIAGASSEIQLLVALQRFHADTWNLVLVHLRKLPRSSGQKYRFSLQLYTKMHGFTYEF